MAALIELALVCYGALLVMLLIGAFFVHAKLWLLVLVSVVLVMFPTGWWICEHHEYRARHGRARPYNREMRDTRGLALYVYGMLVFFHIVRFLWVVPAERWHMFWSLFFNI